MDSFMNDPLGAMSKGLSKAAQAASKAAEDIKNNENIKASLASAKEKSWQGLVAAG